MTIKTEIIAALRAHEVTPEAPLTNLQRGSNIWSDMRTLVVKVSDEQSRYEYLSDLRLFAKAGVRCEQLLIDDVIEIGDSHAVVVGYLKPDRPIRATDAEAVGTLLREVHEATLASDMYEQTKGDVFFPDDWLAQNIIIHNGLPYLVDLDLWKGWEREKAIEVAYGAFLKDFPHGAEDIAAFRRGYGTY